MEILLNEEKVQKAIKFVSLNNRNWSYIFELFKDEIFEMIELKVPKTVIVKFLSRELNSDIKYTTFISWLKKQKIQDSNLQIKKDVLKKEIIQEVKKDTDILKNEEKSRKNKKSKSWQEVIFPQIEEACEGMKKANLRL